MCFCIAVIMLLRLATDYNASQHITILHDSQASVWFNPADVAGDPGEGSRVSNLTTSCIIMRVQIKLWVHLKKEYSIQNMFGKEYTSTWPTSNYLFVWSKSELNNLYTTYTIYREVLV
jgi:hypothetical protein